MKNSTAATTDFGQMLSNAFYKRIADPALFQTLYQKPSYAEFQRKLNDLCTSVFELNEPITRDAVQGIMDALYILQGFECEFLYRIGLQEGLALAAPGFLTDGVGVLND